MTDDAAGPPGDDTVLSVSDASVAFGDVTVLDDASVDLYSGEFTAVIGPNGSGKTTLLQLLAGLRAPDDGTVSRPESAGRTVAYLPQRPGFRGGFTVRETVGFYAALVGADADPEELLERVGLAGAADRPVGALSGGMTRLLGIAQALVGDPPVVVLDEPTSGLDPDVADHIFDVIEDVASEGRLVVTASHDLAAVEARADRVLLVSDGDFALDGSPAALVDAAGTATLREAFSATAGTTDRSAVTRPAPGGGD